jgi:hypothetical protein
MKAKLIKIDNEYVLLADDIVYATTENSPYKKLSKQNCDEIFGVVDVDKLAEESKNEYVKRFNNISKSDYINGFEEGFNKAIELNKDKLFTVDDVKKAINWSWRKTDRGEHILIIDEDDFIQSLQQPAEIEVEIIMKNSRTGNIVKHDSDLEWDEDGLCDRAIPKLDSEGCLILKKI